MPGIPYTISKTATKSKEAKLEPAPVIGPDGKSTHLYFEVASWHTVMNELTPKSKKFHEEEIAKLLQAGKTVGQIEDSGTKHCSGLTLQIGDFWYSIACLYDRNINVATSGYCSTDGMNGLQGKCRGCMTHFSTLSTRLRCTFDPQSALEEKARDLLRHKEWTSKVLDSPQKQSISFSAVLRVLDNGGFIHIKTQADLKMIRTPLSKAHQKIYLTRILARSHYGFRTGSLLILLTEAGINMVSFDRTDSSKKIDEIGQTVVADTWGFNRLSNVLTYVETDQVLALLLAGEYADGDAAFIRRNSDVRNPPRLSDEWEAAIVKKWKGMTPEARLHGYLRPQGIQLQDIRIWSLYEFQELCRRNANSDGNLVCETTGCDLSTDEFGIDRVINDIIAGVSGEYEKSQIIIIHRRLNDFKQGGGRKIFKSVETLEIEKSRLNITELDHRISAILILRHYLDPIRTFRSSQSFRDNMARLAAAK